MMIQNEANFEEKVLLIRPSRTVQEDSSDDEIYEYTRGVWKVGKKQAKRVEYAVCVFGGKVLRVYKINNWYDAGTLPYKYRPAEEINKPGRLEFEGEIDQPMQNKYIGKSCEHLFPCGAQNPVKYINC